ncbi:helix-turn-helix domain-containing protein [Aeromicrobium panaciterrae]|uniref:arsenate reductase/protein-tyrosine-phosphatase family protein n=1 Tax=Aeromicrobium panaciterrae TaxID=363861 RepID=UPI0031D6BDCB
MNTDRTNLAERAARHAALGDVARLAVVDELALGDRSPSELQALLKLPSNLVSHHLKVLEGAGLVARRRSEGDRRRTYLTLADPSVLDTLPRTDMSARRVVFVCSANSARSQLAAALWARASGLPVASAGTHPAEQIAEGARAVAARRSLKLVSSTPHQFDDVTADGDFVVAVCDNAYEELDAPIALHWSIPDPVPQGNDAAFDDAYAELDRRITNLAPRLKAS